MSLRLITLLILSSFLVKCSGPEPEPLEVKQYTIDQFMDNESVFGSSFSSDESKVLVGSNKTGIFNAYTIDVNTAEMTPLTASEDKAARPLTFFPNDDRILYMSDNNGDEIDHIFLRELDGSTGI